VARSLLRPLLLQCCQARAPPLPPLPTGPGMEALVARSLLRPLLLQCCQGRAARPRSLSPPLGTISQGRTARRRCVLAPGAAAPRPAGCLSESPASPDVVRVRRIRAQAMTGARSQLWDGLGQSALARTHGRPRQSARPGARCGGCAPECAWARAPHAGPEQAEGLLHAGPGSAALAPADPQPYHVHAAQDPSADVRQSAFALVGDLSKVCHAHLAPIAGDLVALGTASLQPAMIRQDTMSACNNACWALGAARPPRPRASRLRAASHSEDTVQRGRRYIFTKFSFHNYLIQRWSQNAEVATR